MSTTSEPVGTVGTRRRGQALRDLLGTESLSGRLALGGIAWIAVWAMALLLAFNVLLSSVLASQVDAALRARSEAVASTVSYRDGQLVTAAGNDEALDAGTSIYLGRTLIEGPQLSGDLAERLLQRGEQTADREIFGPVRYLATPITSSGQTRVQARGQARVQVGTIVVSSDTVERTRAAKLIGLASVTFVGLLLLFTFFALRALIRRAMRPVGVMGDQAAAWSDKDIDRRFDPGAGPLELRHLALTLNALLERISATVRHERRLTAELSHEIRTPLAHLHAEVELLSATSADPVAPLPVDAGDLDRLLTSVRRLEGLVETALAPARVQQQGTPGLGLMSEVLADLPSPASSSASLVVGGETGVILAIESDVARRALLPVLENAWRYALREVRIDVSVADGQARIDVTDDGGRLDPDDADAIFEPGFRSPAGDGHPGAGLGLALTRRICRSAGGDATASADHGRTTIRLVLPCLDLMHRVER